MRVLAGKYKSKKIQTINNSNTRPMMSKVREAIFNSIQFLIDDKIFLVPKFYQIHLFHYFQVML